MVQLHVKRLPREEHSKEYDEFLMTAAGSELVGAVTAKALKLQNLRVRLKWMVASARALAAKTAQLDDNAKAALNAAADDGARCLDVSRVTLKVESTVEETEALCAALKGAAMMAFPAQCSGADAQVRLAAVLDGETASEAERATAHGVLALIDDNAATEDILSGPIAIWWSGRPLNSTESLSTYTGKNEKTKIVVKLAKEGAAAPPREPGLDAKTQSEMMAFWYRKQEEAKKLVEDDDISFGNSKWADSNGLKSQLLGMDSIKFKPR